MGADFRDVNNDGKADIFVVAMIGDTFPLFLNRGRGFADVTGRSGLAKYCSNMTGWSNGIADFDNDGWKDLISTNASILDNAEVIDHLPSKLPNTVFRNLNGEKFEDVSALAGASFRVPQFHRGAAFGDLDGDGRIDVVITNILAQPEILLNRSANANHWLVVKLRGVRSNRDGLGARVRIVTPDGKSQYNHATTSVGLSSSSDKRVHFGLGANPAVETLEIVWPSGIRQTQSGIKANQVIEATEASERRP